MHVLLFIGSDTCKQKFGFLQLYDTLFEELVSILKHYEVWFKERVSYNVLCSSCSRLNDSHKIAYNAGSYLLCMWLACVCTMAIIIVQFSWIDSMHENYCKWLEHALVKGKWDVGYSFIELQTAIKHLYTMYIMYNYVEYKDLLRKRSTCENRMPIIELLQWIFYHWCWLVCHV